VQPSARATDRGQHSAPTELSPRVETFSKLRNSTRTRPAAVQPKRRRYAATKVTAGRRRSPAFYATALLGTTRHRSWRRCPTLADVYLGGRMA